MSEQRKCRCRVCGAEVIAGPYIAPEACGSCQLTANAESERLHHERGGGVSEITPEMIYRVAELHGTIKQQAAEIERLRAEIEQLRAIINAKLHRRKCHDCGHVGWYADSRTPYCLCDRCRSQDTRLVKEEK